MSNSDCIDSVLATGTPARPAAGSVFLLIDAAQYPGVCRILQSRFRHLPWVSLSCKAGQEGLGPVLLHLSSNQTRTLAWFIEHTHGLHCLSWIVAPVGLMQLRAHLRSLTRVETEDGARYGMRYYDTRILASWYQMLDCQQEAHALGPISSWTYIDREHMPCSLFGYGQAKIPALQTLKITLVQQQSLLSAALPDMVIQRLEQNGNADLAAMAQSQRYAFIADQVLKATKQYGISSTQEVVLFCSLALGIGKNFDKLLPVTQVLQKFAVSHTANGYASLQNA